MRQDLFAGLFPDSRLKPKSVNGLMCRSLTVPASRVCCRAILAIRASRSFPGSIFYADGTPLSNRGPPTSPFSC